jgi:hypothetical protein
MKRLRLLLILALAMIIGLSVVGALAAETSSGLGAISRPRHVMDAGSQAVSVNGVSMRGSLGQPIVGVRSNGDVVLEQGFWHGRETGEEGLSIYLPLVMK